MNQHALHTFHIPVMGLSYTIDSPIRVAAFGISSAISIMDDELIEKMRQVYSRKFGFAYEEITQKMHDHRANRITSYLNLTERIVKQKFEDFKNTLTQSSLALNHFITMLPNQSWIKTALDAITDNESLNTFIQTHLKPGSIDVNIMTKLDKENFVKKIPLPVEFNDAHAALRGFAESTLESSVILSAGMNPRLYSYFENFPDFFPNANGTLKKKVILKVSDFRSAMIQGNFLAKKGIWVSEYRIESGLNCGGHAFATDGYLLGPILEQFRQKKNELIESAHELVSKAFVAKGIPIPENSLPLKITVQGGIGTASEHQFMIDHYAVDSVGWGSPFLLVPEATAMDKDTRKLLCDAGADDLFLSNISPLGVPFNSVNGTSNENYKQQRVTTGKAGSACPKKFLALQKDDSGAAICTASRKYQQEKIAILNLRKTDIPENDYQKKIAEITEKSCLCVGLSNSALIENNISLKGESQGIVVCPGPNIAYFEKEIKLSKMVRHIYGNDNVLSKIYRPHVFINELKMYVDHFLKLYSEFLLTNVNASKIEKFRNNLLDGIAYYEDLFQQQNIGNDQSQGEIAAFKKMLTAINLKTVEC